MDRVAVGEVSVVLASAATWVCERRVSPGTGFQTGPRARGTAQYKGNS